MNIISLASLHELHRNYYLLKIHKIPVPLQLECIYVTKQICVKIEIVLLNYIFYKFYENQKINLYMFIE